MFKNKSLLISIFVVVFLVVIAGGVATSVLANNRSTGAPKLDAASAVATYQAREAEYRALLAQANGELEQANQQITAMARTITENASKNTYPVDAQTAMAIAYQSAGDYALSEPELVNYDGTAAYEVRFQNGAIYVDATTGEILFNAIQAPSAQSISAEQAARLAVAYIGSGDIQSVAVTSYNGSSVYGITFTNGKVVYVSLTGKILAVKIPAGSSTLSNHETETEDSHQSSGTSESTPAPTEEHESEHEVDD